MKLFAVAIRDYSVAFIEFYEAETEDDALDKAVNDHPLSRIICAEQVEKEGWNCTLNSELSS